MKSGLNKHTRKIQLNDVVVEKKKSSTLYTEEKVQRSISKTRGYRLILVILDLVFIYFFSGRIKVAVGFMIVSHIYLIVCYFFYERIWAKINRGRSINIQDTILA